MRKYLTQKECEKIWEECQCAGGEGGISSFTPENMRGLFVSGGGMGNSIDTLPNEIATGGGKFSPNKKKSMYTGTGIVYASSHTKKLTELFEEIYELSHLSEERAESYSK